MSKLNKAFTLIELLICLSILSILASAVFPAFGNMIIKSKVDANKQRLVQTLHLGRTTAITRNKKVTICPTVTGLICSANWSSGYLLFVDNNGDRSLNNQDEILYQYLATDVKSELNWRAFGVRSSLQWLQTGITNHQNGSFYLCYDNKPEFARGLYITKAGRVRFSKDTDGDDLHENSTGGRINC